MIYLAALKGLDSSLARSRAEKWLSRVNMQAHRNKKIEELSHGMAQIIQFLVTILHEPDVIILDEPFNGLDPINVKMVKDIILELKNQGEAIMLSTHRMNEVEELCDRIFMINKGRNVLYGPIGDIKAKYRDNSVMVEFEGDYDITRNFRARKISGRTFEIFPEDGMTYQALLQSLVASGSHIVKFEVSTPSLNDIFIRVAGGNNE